MKNIILGAGVTGLSYANFCNSQSIILEKEKEYGGYCRTIKQDGFIWDYSGHFFHFRDENIKNFILGNLSSKDLKTVQKVTKIFYKKNYVDFPFQKNIHQLPQGEFIDCIYDLFNTHDLDASFSPSSFKAMVYANYGKSIAEKFLIPYNEKLYACDLNTLDSDAMGRFFPAAKKEEIIQNFRNSNNQSYNDYFIYPQNGAFEYIKGLANTLHNKSEIRLNEEVVRIDTNKKQVFTQSSVYPYDKLISTLPFPTLLKLCDICYDKQIYSFNKVLIFNLGFDKKGRDSKTSWVYFPEKEFIFYRVGYYDNILKSDRMSLYIEIGLQPNQDVNINDLLYRVLIDLTKVGIIHDENLVSYSTVMMNPAYVHISQDSCHDVKIKKGMLQELDIYSIGRYGSWTYCSIEDNIKEACELAQKFI